MVQSSPAGTFVVSPDDATMLGYFYQLFGCGSGGEGGVCPQPKSRELLFNEASSTAPLPVVGPASGSRFTL